jgi:hypothetical protein
MRMTKLPALAILIPALAGMAGVLQASAYDLYGDGDRYAHPRSVEEYRAIVPDEADEYGMCRNAEHLAECLAEISGADVGDVRKWLEGGVPAIRRFR